MCYKFRNLTRNDGPHKYPLSNRRPVITPIDMRKKTCVLPIQLFGAKSIDCMGTVAVPYLICDAEWPLRRLVV